MDYVSEIEFTSDKKLSVNFYDKKDFYIEAFKKAYAGSIVAILHAAVFFATVTSNYQRIAVSNQLSLSLDLRYLGSSVFMNTHDFVGCFANLVFKYLRFNPKGMFFDEYDPGLCFPQSYLIQGLNRNQRMMILRWSLEYDAYMSKYCSRWTSVHEKARQFFINEGTHPNDNLEQSTVLYHMQPRYFNLFYRGYIWMHEQQTAVIHDTESCTLIALFEDGYEVEKDVKVPRARFRKSPPTIGVYYHSIPSYQHLGKPINRGVAPESYEDILTHHMQAIIDYLSNFDADYVYASAEQRFELLPTSTGAHYHRIPAYQHLSSQINRGSTALREEYLSHENVMSMVNQLSYYIFDDEIEEKIFCFQTERHVDVSFSDLRDYCPWVLQRTPLVQETKRLILRSMIEPPGYHQFPKYEQLEVLEAKFPALKEETIKQSTIRRINLFMQQLGLMERPRPQTFVLQPVGPKPVFKPTFEELPAQSVITKKRQPETHKGKKPKADKPKANQVDVQAAPKPAQGVKVKQAWSTVVAQHPRRTLPVMEDTRRLRLFDFLNGLVYGSVHSVKEFRTRIIPFLISYSSYRNVKNNSGEEYALRRSLRHLVSQASKCPSDNIVQKILDTVESGNCNITLEDMAKSTLYYSEIVNSLVEQFLGKKGPNVMILSELEWRDYMNNQGGDFFEY